MIRMRLTGTPTSTTPLELNQNLNGEDVVFKTDMYALKEGAEPGWVTYVRKTRTGFDVKSVHYVCGIPRLEFHEGEEQSLAGAIKLAKQVKKEQKYDSRF